MGKDDKKPLPSKLYELTEYKRKMDKNIPFANHSYFKIIDQLPKIDYNSVIPKIDYNSVIPKIDYSSVIPTVYNNPLLEVVERVRAMANQLTEPITAFRNAIALTQKIEWINDLFEKTDSSEYQTFEESIYELLPPEKQIPKEERTPQKTIQLVRKTTNKTTSEIAAMMIFGRKSFNYFYGNTPPPKPIRDKINRQRNEYKEMLKSNFRTTTKRKNIATLEIFRNARTYMEAENIKGLKQLNQKIAILTEIT